MVTVFTAAVKRWSKELLWRQFSCSGNAPLSIAENFAVADRDMNAVLLEKQQQLLTRAEETTLKPNTRDFPTSWKRKMTGPEAALQKERDVLVRRRREIRQAKENEGFRH
jgi:hypothetical protein